MSDLRARRNSDLRRQNLLDVLQVLRRRGRMSRAELTAVTTLSKQALASILNELVEKGYAVEVSTRVHQRGPGRPALRYEYNPHRSSVVSLYIGLRYSEISVCDGLGRPVVANVEFHPGWQVDRIVEEAAARVAAMCDEAGVRGLPCHTGAVVHGSVDVASGVVDSEEMGWERVPLADLLTTAFGGPATVNDASRAAAIAESREGAAVGAHRATVLNTGPHIIATQVVDGVADFGSTGLAGVIDRAHVPADGGTSSVDDLIGSFALKRRYRDLTGRHVDWMSEVLELAKEGDTTAESLVGTYLDTLAYASMWLLTIANPDRLVITGVAGDYAERWRARVHTSITELTDPRLLERCTVRFTELGRQAWMRGGIHAALDDISAHERASM